MRSFVHNQKVLAQPGATTQLVLLVTLFVAVFMQGALSDLVFGASRVAGNGGDAVYARLLVEALVVLNVLSVIAIRRGFRMPAGTGWFAAFACWSVLSALVVEPTSNWYLGLAYSRYTVYTVLVYAVVLNSRFSTLQMHRLWSTIGALFFLQLFVSIYKVAVIGDRTEWRVGTVTISGGQLATLVPLLALAGAMAYYFYLRRSWWVPPLSVSFGIVGFASGKRAIFFVVPVFLALIATLYLFVNGGFGRVRAHLRMRMLLHTAAAIAISSPVVMYGLLNTDFGREMQSTATSAEIISAAADFARRYEFSEHGGAEAGRGSSSLRIARELAGAPASVQLFGWGPSSFHQSSGNSSGGGYSPLGIEYGITGWSHMAISIGMPAVGFFILGYLSLWRSAISVLRYGYAGTLQRALAFFGAGGLLVLGYEFFIYGYSFVGSGIITFTAAAATACAKSTCARSAVNAPEQNRQPLRQQVPGGHLLTRVS